MIALTDLNFALRRLRRAPAFAAAVILMLALGIGLSAAMFGVLRGVLGSLPYPGGDRVVSIEGVNARQGVTQGALTPAEVDALSTNDARSPFEQAGDYSWGGVTVFDDQHPREITVGSVGKGFFPTLGMTPMLGRWFSREEFDAPQHYIMLSHGEWLRLLGGRADAIGSEIETSQGRMRVVGVMPPAFAFPATDVGGWVPRIDFDTAHPSYRFARMLYGVGRLRADVDASQIDERLASIAAAVRAQQRLPDDGWGFAAPPLLETMIGDVRGTVWGAFAIALLVLLIACANVAILFDARLVAQRHEQIIAHALGASAARLLRTRLFELSVLTAAGALLGVFAAWAGLDAVRALAQDSVPRAEAIAIDPLVLLFAIGLALVTPFLVLLAGVFRSRETAATLLRSGGKGMLGGGNRARRLVPAIAIALSTVSLISAAALVLSLSRLSAVSPGFRTADVHALQLFRDGPPEGRPIFASTMRDRLAAMPGVTHVAIATAAPLSGIGSQAEDATVVGVADAKPVHVGVRRVDPGYLGVLDIPVLAGRGISVDDRAGGERVVVINHTYARRLVGEDTSRALDQRVSLAVGRDGLQTYRIVGVVGDVRNHGLRAPAEPEVLLAFAQQPWVGMTFLVRTAQPVAGMARLMAEQMWAIDPRQSITRQFALADDVAAQWQSVRFFTLTMGVFALCSLVLGAFGVYAVASLAQRRRVREFGLRLAVGARPAALGMQVLRDGLVIVIAGAALGVVGALAALRLIAAQTFGIDDALALVVLIGALAMALAALAALMVPALRAIRTDPMTALRYE
jgi:predicted permease